MSREKWRINSESALELESDSYLSKDQILQEGHVIKVYKVNVSSSVSLLFVRHLRAQLHVFARFSRGVTDSYTFADCWVTGSSEQNGVPFWISFAISPQDAIAEVLTSVSTTGRLADVHDGRPPFEQELSLVRSQIAGAIRKAAGHANAGRLRLFFASHRIDGDLPLYVPRPLRFDSEFIVTLPRYESDQLSRSTTEFANNPAIGWYFPTKATDADDATHSCADGLRRRVIFWTLLSGTYCRATSRLFTPFGNRREGLVKMREARLADDIAKSMQTYNNPRSVRALAKVRRLWKAFDEMPPAVIAAAAAYHTATQVRSRSFYSQATAAVSYIAALESLMPTPHRCGGTLSCDVCSWSVESHRSETHQAALCRGLATILKGKNLKTAEELVRVAYRKIRSLYVHGGHSVLQEHKARSLHTKSIYDEDQYWGPSTNYYALLSNLDELTAFALWKRIGYSYTPQFYKFQH